MAPSTRHAWARCNETTISELDGSAGRRARVLAGMGGEVANGRSDTAHHRPDCENCTQFISENSRDRNGRKRSRSSRWGRVAGESGQYDNDLPLPARSGPGALSYRRLDVRDRDHI